MDEKESAGDLLAQIVQALDGDVEVSVRVYYKGVYSAAHIITSGEANLPFMGERVLDRLLRRLLAEVKK